MIRYFLMSTRSVDSASSSICTYQFRDIPNELLTSIFNECVSTTKDFVVFTRVCHQWREMVHSPHMLKRFLNILEKYYMIPSTVEACWQLIGEAYQTKCEIHVDISASMCVQAPKSDKLILTLKVHEKIKELMSLLSPCLKQISLLAFSDFEEKVFNFPGDVSLQDALNQLDDCEHGGTQLDSLNGVLTSYDEAPDLKKKTLLFVISDLCFPMRGTAFLNNIKEIALTTLIRNNLEIFFIEVPVTPHNDRFKANLKDFLAKDVCNYVHIEEAPENAGPLTGKKRKREDDAFT